MYAWYTKHIAANYESAVEFHNAKRAFRDRNNAFQASLAVIQARAHIEDVDYTGITREEIATRWSYVYPNGSRHNFRTSWKFAHPGIIVASQIIAV